MAADPVPIRIVLADNHREYRQALAGWLTQKPDLAVVGEASSGDEAIKLAADLEPDVVVIDVVMPGTRGIDATRQIVEHRSSTRVLGLSLHAERAFVDRMMEAGASGYLLKDDDWEDVADALRSVVGGRRMLSPKIPG